MSTRDERLIAAHARVAALEEELHFLQGKSSESQNSNAGLVALSLIGLILVGALVFVLGHARGYWNAGSASHDLAARAGGSG